MGIGEDIFDKSTECFKEVALYTPTGATLLHEVSIFPAEATHFIIIGCCPMFILLVKERRRRKERKRSHGAHSA